MIIEYLVNKCKFYILVFDHYLFGTFYHSPCEVIMILHSDSETRVMNETVWNLLVAFYIDQSVCEK